MKILHTESSLGWGGQEIRILSESVGLIARGHEVTLACPPQATIFTEAQRYRVPAIPLPIEKKRVGGLLAMRRLLGERRFDVINTHSSTDSWLAALACAARSGAPPIVRTRHVSTALGNRPTTRWLYDKAASCIVTTGEKLRLRLIEETGLTQVPIVSVPTGIDPGRFAPRNAVASRALLGLTPQGFVYGIVATLRSWKGHRYLIDAFAKVRRDGDRLLIVGEGPQHDALVAQVGTLGLSGHVILAGKQDKPEEWFNCFDVMCLPSYANEGVPQSLMQAMMSELPCITCDVGAISEIARDGETALIVEKESVEALAAAMTRLRDDHALGDRLGKAARVHILSRYSYARMCDDMEAIFSAVAAGEPALSRLASVAG